MKKLTKKAAVLACAMLMTAGGFSQASASSLSVPYYGAELTGKTVRSNSTTATASTLFKKNTLDVNDCTVTVRAYVKVNGSYQYGPTGSGYDWTANDATATTQVYIISGIGTTGYGGEHTAHFNVLDKSGGGYKTLRGTSSY